MRTKTMGVLTGAALVLGLAVPTAGHATAEPVPTFRFDDCPALPVGVDPARWRCEEMQASGTIRIGSRTVPVNLKATHAEGPPADGGPTQFVFGRLRAEPVRVPGFVPAWLTLEYAGHIDFREGPPLAEVLHLKYRLSAPLVGPDCHLGTDADPMRVVGVVVGDRVPVSADPPVLRFLVEDKDFTAPRSAGCGHLGRWVDRWFGLPAPGSLALTVYFAIRPYESIMD
jgi:hypothetical protein